MNKIVNDFCESLDNEKFFEAHEILEKIWYKNRFSKEKEILLLKGFINAAVSFELHKKKKINQSFKVWKTYLKYSSFIEDINENIEDYIMINNKIIFISKKLNYPLH